MPEVYSSQDIWMGAYFLSTNAQLVDVQISRNGRETVSFSFRGENLSQLAQEYCQEQAQANIAELRRKLNTLRDFIFQARQKR